MTRSTLKQTVLLASLLAVPALSLAAPVTVKDIVGRQVKLDLPTKRVVLGFYFEDYMAIGGEKAYDKVVGISREAWEGWRPANWALFSAKRPSLKTLADVGEVEVQTFSVEKVLALKPDVLVLAEWQYKGLGPDVKRLEDGRLLVHFQTEASAIAPGQSAVFYIGRRVVGGSFIASQRGIGMFL